MASTVPRLRRAVELLLTDDQHKPCTSFNQQAYKNTTSVAEGKRKTPQKFRRKQTPKTGQFLDPQNGGVFFNIFVHFGANFCGVFRLPSATDVVFLHACWLKLVHGLCWSSVSNNSTALCRRGAVFAQWGFVQMGQMWPVFQR